MTTSSDYPRQNADQTAYAGGWEGFRTKLAPAGKALVYRTYLGGTDNDVVYGVALDRSTRASVTGMTRSGNFPRRLPLDDTLGGSQDAFVARFAANGVRDWSTFLGGSSDEWGSAIAVAPSGDVTVVGTRAA